MKHLLYTFKKWLEAIFCYPMKTINLTSASNYDAYWREKRGKNIGNLSSWQKERADFILDMVKRDKEIVFADVGCGDGSILNYLKEALPNRVRLMGYDSSKVVLAHAGEMGIETCLLDVAEKDQCKNLEAADYYLLLEILEHVPHSEFLLYEALEKARKGVFFSFPNTGYITYRLRLLFGKFPVQWRVFPNEHVRFWTYTDVRWWLRALGIQNYTLHCYKGIPILNRLFPRLFAAAFIIFIEKND